MSTMRDFQAIRSEKARSIQDTMEVREYGSALDQAGSSIHDEGVHVRKSRKEEMQLILSKISPYSKKYLS